MTGKIIRSRRWRDRRKGVRRDRLRTFVRRAVAVVVVGSTLTIGAAVAGSSLFSLGDVKVVGVRKVTAAQIRDVAGLKPGTNVLTLDLEGAKRRVEAMDQIRSAVVRRAGALGVEIRVVERTPALIVRAGDERTYFDLEGVEVAGPATGRVPVLRIPTETRSLGDGRVVEVVRRPDAEIVAGVLRTWAAAGALRDSVSRFDLTPRGLIMVAGGVSVTFGPATDNVSIRAEMSALKTIMDWAAKDNQKLRSVDVSVPDRPAMRIA